MREVVGSSPTVSTKETCSELRERVSDFYGGVAQLGERTVRIRKVESSILFVSTKKKTPLESEPLRFGQQ